MDRIRVLIADDQPVFRGGLRTLLSSLGPVEQGHDNAWMARHFALGRTAIRAHVSNSFTKLQVAHRAQAIARAREAGMGQQATRN